MYFSKLFYLFELSIHQRIFKNYHGFYNNIAKKLFNIDYNNK